jgi:uncharacterized membrane protein YciS (DUF1049 family)
MWAIRVILIALIIVCVVAFALYNVSANQVVSVNLVLWGPFIDVPLVTVVFWSFVAGVVTALLVFISGYIRLSVQLRSAKKRARALENEVTVLRNRPIEESADMLQKPQEPTGEARTSLRVREE